jgi:hypothetical protein
MVKMLDTAESGYEPPQPVGSIYALALVFLVEISSRKAVEKLA